MRRRVEGWKRGMNRKGRVRVGRLEISRRGCRRHVSDSHVPPLRQDSTEIYAAVTCLTWIVAHALIVNKILFARVCILLAISMPDLVTGNPADMLYSIETPRPPNNLEHRCQSYSR
jgi:hypothetical protein